MLLLTNHEVKSYLLDRMMSKLKSLKVNNIVCKRALQVPWSRLRKGSEIDELERITYLIEIPKRHTSRVQGKGKENESF
ncbi:unnamed protein product [Linum trigynum]|uniref:Uncharacterized protein n=1 Tax=Linum trigynum TaxID=586398 RepID=A0AAV2G7D0_9ROSI